MSKPNFVISVKDTKNGSWQGTIFWAEEKKEMCFRSSLELLILMESIVSPEK
ncbi:hypothetical protein ACWG0P_05590 [Amedibacillus sp. YH-ame6]